MERIGIMGIYSLYAHLPVLRAYNSITIAIKTPTKMISQLFPFKLGTNIKGKDKMVMIIASATDARKRINSVIVPPM